MDHDEFDAKSNYSKEDIRSKGSRGTTSEKLTKSVTSTAHMQFTQNNFKFELNESCFISMLKLVKIEKLESKFLLVSHPYP